MKHDSWNLSKRSLSISKLSPLRAAKERLTSLLADASSARTKSIRLQGVDFATELSSGLMQFATEREADFTKLQKLVAATNEKEIKPMLIQLDEKDAWFTNAEASVSHGFGKVCFTLRLKLFFCPWPCRGPQKASWRRWTIQERRRRERLPRRGLTSLSRGFCGVQTFQSDSAIA